MPLGRGLARGGKAQEEGRGARGGESYLLDSLHRRGQPDPRTNSYCQAADKPDGGGTPTSGR
ncbi:hypothetical protein GCM10023346_15560 [Arthrobacter gyeryongensis]|uniref:Uncharacterized protein n=1 Tax=Arthrobacter gyeryongensis TaxID=1650592 RepID=A0ABP9SAX0_9MICC